MKALFLVSSLLIAMAHLVLGAPPKALIQDLDNLPPLRKFESVAALPEALRQSLADTFDQKKLELANPSDSGRRSSFAENEEEPLPPVRRLRFAFETRNYYIVYYDVGHPWGTAFVLVFSKNSHQKPRLTWGGADLKWPNCAKTPEELRSRMLRGAVKDDLSYIW